MNAVRKIIHIDMDAFYASVEQRDELRYRGKPLVVGGSPTQRGTVAAASYEARQYGIHSAMPSCIVHYKCPHLIFVQPRFEVYRAISEQIREIFDRYIDLVELLALDEAYLDVIENKLGLPSATLMAQEIKRCIYEETQLTVSAGVSINKFLAKIASGMDKPNGLFLIPPEQAQSFIEQLPTSQFYGVGQGTATKMHHLGIQTGADLKQWTEGDLIEQFGKVGRFYYRIARAQDDSPSETLRERPVQPNRIRKSIGAENSFDPDLTDCTRILTELETIAQTLKQRMDKQQSRGRTLTLKLEYADYQQVTCSRTLIHPIQELNEIFSLATELLALTEVEHKSVRLLGLALSNLSGEIAEEYVQLSLGFADAPVSKRS